LQLNLIMLGDPMLEMAESMAELPLLDAEIG
jgi:hypothetical protein